MKKCSTCKSKKPLEGFNKNKSTRDGLHNQCRECSKLWWKNMPPASAEKRKQYRRNYDRLKLANFSSELFEQRLSEQGNRCAICKTDDPGETTWHADHDHITGEPRGVLCKKCNTGIGMLNDDIGLIQNALSYLNHYTR